MTVPCYRDIAAQVGEAAAHRQPLSIRGGGSKAFLGRDVQGEVLELAELKGIIAYEPTELVITARAGTPLRDIEATLAENGQMLGFEPPRFDTTATLGGTIACGLSGPARPFQGAARDFVLGTQIVNGKGEVLKFGGEVMKNVAGYDVSRLMCGAFGTLGVLLELSVKVVPRPKSEMTLALEMHEQDAFASMAQWQREPLPLTGLSYDGDRLHVRLAGAGKAVEAARRRIGGEPDPRGEVYWTRLREQHGAFFEAKGDLWRVSVPATTAALPISGRTLIDWGGALRWIKTAQPPESLFEVAASVGGHAMLFRGAQRDRVFQPLPAGLMQLHARLKRAFDPDGILNPGRQYAGL